MMNQLVFIHNNQVVTDSLSVADAFKKRHSDVIRSVENLECSPEFTERNFALSNYKDSTGRVLKKYIITQDGFSFLAMGYTGKEAARFKEMYIAEFNRMKHALNNQQVTQIPTELNAINNLLLASQGMIQQLTQINHKVQTVEADIQDVKQGMVDINQPLRDQFNEEVRKLARRANISYNEAYNQVYAMLGKHHHVDIKRRVENRKNKGQTVRAIDIVEELNLLVPAIRMAKVMASVS